MRFGLTEGQTAVLGRAADALRAEREQIGRLDTLVAIGHESRVRLGEQRPAAAGRAPGRRRLRQRRRPRVGLLGGGHLRFPDELATGPELAGRRRDDAARGGERRGPRRHGTGHIWTRGRILACPLTVKDKPAGVLLTRRQSGFSERDRSLFASLASQLSMGMENARLYHQLDGLFRPTCRPDVATALLADPEQAALGGAVVEVTALFADLRGFTSFSERSTPEEIVVMLNRYFEHATAAILDEGGTVVQFVGDALMALFNAPARQHDHAVRAAAAALAHAGGGRGHGGVLAGLAAVPGRASTPVPRWSATSAAPRCAASTRWATR